jgi:hypothetical protein
MDAPNEMQWGSSYLAENGVKIIGQPYAKTVSLRDTPAAQQTFQFMANLMAKYHVAAPLGPRHRRGRQQQVKTSSLSRQGQGRQAIEAGDWITAGLPS